MAVSVTTGRHYKPIVIPPGALASSLKAFGRWVTSQQQLELTVLRYDRLEDGSRYERGSSDYGLLDTVCALGQTPHEDVVVIWKWSGRRFSVTLTRAADVLYVVATGADGEEVGSFFDHLETALGLERAPEGAVKKGKSGWTPETPVTLTPRRPKSIKRVEAWLRRQKEEHGTLWALVGFVLLAVIAALGVVVAL